MDYWNSSKNIPGNFNSGDDRPQGATIFEWRNYTI
jgi:hypothetical protein